MSTKTTSKKSKIFWISPSEVRRVEAQNKNFDDLDSSRLAYNNSKLNYNFILSKIVFVGRKHFFNTNNKRHFRNNLFI